MSARITFCVIPVFISLLAFCDTSVLPTTMKLAAESSIDVTLKCRQKCLSKILNEFKFSGNLLQYLQCKSAPNCYMCWDYCRAVSVAQKDLAHSMCSDKKFCTKGCKVACQFHRIRTINNIIDAMSNDS